VIFRIDALRALADHGVRCVNTPRAIERTVNKSWASALLGRAGVPPATIVCERYDDAMQAFDWAATSWSSRCSARWATRSCASRIETWPIGCFVPLELEPIVYYVQRTVVPAGRLRDPVVAGEVAGAMERVTHSSRANVACHARPHAVTPNDDERDLTLAAAAPIEADVAGMDLLIASDGEAVVLDVTGTPGWQALQSACEQDPTELVMST
jgi:glutathione synthase/RimK-type ligase-like ATP-grasp enzyme